MKKYWELHKWFCRTSRSYIGEYDLQHVLRFPIAYVKFMYYSLVIDR